MSYQGQTWVDEVALPRLKNGGELLVMLRVANHAGNGPRKMAGCYASAESLAGECLMGRSTVLRHLSSLEGRGLLIPGDPQLVEHIRADRRPPVYDLAGAHEASCRGGHSIDGECAPVAGAQIEHPSEKPRATGAQIKHPSKRRRSAGAQSEDPSPTGAQIEQPRVLKSSTKSSKELKALSPPPVDPSVTADPAASAGVETDEREGHAARQNHLAVPGQRPDPAALAASAEHDQVQGTEETTALVLAGWAAGAGLSRPPTSVRRVLVEQIADLAVDYGPAALQVIARFAGGRRWEDLGRAAMHPDCVKHLQARAGHGQGQGPADPCPQHPHRAAAECAPCRAGADGQAETEAAPADPSAAAAAVRARLGIGRSVGRERMRRERDAARSRKGREAAERERLKEIEGRRAEALRAYEELQVQPS